MKDKTKEKLLKEIENKIISYINRNNQLDYSRVIRKTIRETSKAKDKEFIKILDEVMSEKTDSTSFNSWKDIVIYEIKQRRKEQ